MYQESDPELFELSQRIPGFSSDELEQYLLVLHGNELHFTRRGDRLMFLPHNHFPTIEVGGSPRSFKTSMIEKTVGFLKDLGIEANYIPEPVEEFMTNASFLVQDTATKGLIQQSIYQNYIWQGISFLLCMIITSTEQLHVRVCHKLALIEKKKDLSQDLS